MIHYAGIGSRQTPPDVFIRMESIAATFAQKGLILRSGGADGADTAFEQGCDAGGGDKEIFLPWKGFNKNDSNLFDVPEEAFEITQAFHPAWHKLSLAVQKLMARNAQQILGKNLDSPSSFVVCWTPDGCNSHATRTHKTGGTGQAISIASAHGIPIVNINTVNDKSETNDMLADLGVLI